MSRRPTFNVTLNRTPTADGIVQEIAGRCAPEILCAIYARKSDEQDCDEIAKSTERQFASARAFAATKPGWKIDEDAIFWDEITGAEFERRPGFMALMDAIKNGPRFKILIVFEDSRLGRELLDTGSFLKKMIQAGIQIYTSKDGNRIAIEKMEDKLIWFARGVASEMERENARTRTKDALVRKFELGHATGAPKYGFTNIRQKDAAGVDRGFALPAIHPDEAPIVLRVWERAATGAGNTTIARELQKDGVPGPGGNGWTKDGVGAILAAGALYCGTWTYNKTAAKDAFGQKNWRKRERAEHLTQERPTLRILSDVLFHKVEAIRAPRRQRASVNARRQWRDQTSPYLLSGLLACGVCGGPMQVDNGGGKRNKDGVRKPGTLVYVCGRRRRRGADACSNAARTPLATLDALWIGKLKGILSDERAATPILDAAFAPAPTSSPAVLERLRASIEKIEKELKTLVDKLASIGGDAIENGIRERQAKRTELLVELQERTPRASKPKPGASRTAVAAVLGNELQLWRAMLDDEPATARALVAELQGTKPIVFTLEDGRPVLDGEIDLESAVRRSAALEAVQSVALGTQRNQAYRHSIRAVA